MMQKQYPLSRKYNFDFYLGSWHALQYICDTGEQGELQLWVSHTIVNANNGH
jgi:hypothetical protein